MAAAFAAPAQVPPPATWAQEIRGYEREKRHTVDEGLLLGPHTRVTCAQMSYQDRQFDPVLQRYRDNTAEAHSRMSEEKHRVAHLNRAQDIQILREQPFDIIRHESKLEALAPGLDPTRLGGGNIMSRKPRNKEGNPTQPDSALDYNIVSNLPMQDHHWARPGDRPPMKERMAEPRKVPQHQVKDFNIINNRYLQGDATKKREEKDRALVDASRRYLDQRPFDPVVQQFSDARREEVARTCEHAQAVEANMRSQAQQPPSYKVRESSFYNAVSHEVQDKDMVQLADASAQKRKERYKNRYIVEHNWHVQEVKGDQIRETRRLNKQAPERYDEQRHRGYDIIENRSYGSGTKEKVFHEPFVKARLSPWEQAQIGQGSSESNAFQKSGGELGGSSYGNPSKSLQLYTGSSPDLQVAPQRGRSQDVMSTSAASQRSAATAASSQRRRQASENPGATVRLPVELAPPGRTAPPGRMAPPPPAIPGSPFGSVYSRREPA